MGNLLSNLKKYLSSNSKEQILDDWAATAEYDNIGPTVDEFMQTLSISSLGCFPPSDECTQQNLTMNFTNYKNPEFSSGFCLNLNQ